jgi:hypothetical protein
MAKASMGVSYELPMCVRFEDDQIRCEMRHSHITVNAA